MRTKEIMVNVFTKNTSGVTYDRHSREIELDVKSFQEEEKVGLTMELSTGRVLEGVSCLTLSTTVLKSIEATCL